MPLLKESLPDLLSLIVFTFLGSLFLGCSMLNFFAKPWCLEFEHCLQRDDVMVFSVAISGTGIVLWVSQLCSISFQTFFCTFSILSRCHGCCVSMLFSPFTMYSSKFSSWPITISRTFTYSDWLIFYPFIVRLSSTWVLLSSFFFISICIELFESGFCCWTLSDVHPCR